MGILLALEIKITGQASYRSCMCQEEGDRESKRKRVIPFGVESAVRLTDKQL